MAIPLSDIIVVDCSIVGGGVIPIIGTTSDLPTPDFQMPLFSNFNILIGNGTATQTGTNPVFDKNIGFSLIGSGKITLSDPPMVGYSDVTLSAILNFQNFSSSTGINSTFGLGSKHAVNIVTTGNGFVIGNFSGAPNSGGFYASGGKDYKIILRRLNGELTMIVNGVTVADRSVETIPIDSDNDLLVYNQQSSDALYYRNCRIWNYGLTDKQLALV